MSVACETAGLVTCEDHKFRLKGARMIW